MKVYHVKKLVRLPTKNICYLQKRWNHFLREVDEQVKECVENAKQALKKRSEALTTWRAQS